VQKLVRRNTEECLFFIWGGQCWNPHLKVRIFKCSYVLESLLQEPRGLLSSP
jgi:hypothetical protein